MSLETFDMSGKPDMLSARAPMPNGTACELTS
jgi:hypothetical protein